MDEVLSLVLPDAVAWVAIFALFAWDDRRMTEAQRARAWPTASRRIAVVYFSPLCVPLHFLRTRRNVRGVVEAVAWTVVLVALLAGVDFVLEALLTTPS
jgi:hypothetical protein